MRTIPLHSSSLRFIEPSADRMFWELGNGGKCGECPFSYGDDDEDLGSDSESESHLKVQVAVVSQSEEGS